MRTYTATVTFEGKAYTDQKTEAIPATGHHYGQPEWTWNGFETASATFKCRENDDTQTVGASITSAVTTPETCTKNGVRTYTATVTFEGKAYTDQKTEAIPATGHHYGQPEWTWNGFETASATFKCRENDDTQTVGATVTSAVTTPETCTENGVRTYTATVTFEGETYTDQKTKAIPATGHHYGQPEWTWNSDGTAFASFTCVEGDDTQIRQAGVFSEITKPATYEESGVRTSAAIVVFNGAVYTDTNTETIPRLNLIGDVNLDGRIDIRDATMIQKHLAGLITLEGEALVNADADGSGTVDINDVTHLQKYLAKYDVTLGKQPA